MRARACPHCHLSFIQEPEPDQATMVEPGVTMRHRGSNLAFIAYCLVGFVIVFAVMDFTS